MIKFRYAGNINLLIRFPNHNINKPNPDDFVFSAALTLTNEEDNRL